MVEGVSGVKVDRRVNATGAMGAYWRASILGLGYREINCGLAGGLSSRRGLCTDAIERAKGGGDSINKMHVINTT